VTVEVKCPTCQKAVKWNSQAKYRPFCCERCKLIDLGEWASGGHAIPGKPVEDELMSGDINGELADSLDELKRH